jgi:uncharacterized protein YecA (UPF0149 family)
MKKMKNNETIYELRKDISTPEMYIRAGEQKTKSDWKKIFPRAFLVTFDQWFIDISEKQKPEESSERMVVDAVFAKKKLHSITYKEAAVDAIKIYTMIYLCSVADEMPNPSIVRSKANEMIDDPPF